MSSKYSRADLAQLIADHDAQVTSPSRKGFFGSSFACACAGTLSGAATHAFCMIKIGALTMMAGTPLASSELMQSNGFSALTTLAGTAVGTGAWWAMRRHKSNRTEKAIAITLAFVSATAGLTLNGHAPSMPWDTEAPHGNIALRERWDRATVDQQRAMIDLMKAGVQCESAIVSVCGQQRELGEKKIESSIPRPVCIQ